MKLKLLKKIACLNLLITFSLSSLNFLSAQTSPPTWTQIKEEKGITISYQLAKCNNQNFLFYQIKNSTNHSATVFCSLIIKDADGNIILTLPLQRYLSTPKVDIQGSCEQASSDYAKPLPPSAAYKVEVVNIKIM